MGVNNYTTITKTDVKGFINYALQSECIVANPIEHYSIDEIKELAKSAKENGLILSIKSETSNFYQGVMINLIPRERIKEEKLFLDHI